MPLRADAAGNSRAGNSLGSTADRTVFITVAATALSVVSR